MRFVVDVVWLSNVCVRMMMVKVIIFVWIVVFGVCMEGLIICWVFVCGIMMGVMFVWVGIKVVGEF